MITISGTAVQPILDLFQGLSWPTPLCANDLLGMLFLLQVFLLNCKLFPGSFLPQAEGALLYPLMWFDQTCPWVPDPVAGPQSCNQATVL